MLKTETGYYFPYWEYHGKPLIYLAFRSPEFYTGLTNNLFHSDVNRELGFFDRLYPEAAGWLKWASRKVATSKSHRGNTYIKSLRLCNHLRLSTRSVNRYSLVRIGCPKSASLKFSIPASVYRMTSFPYLKRYYIAVFQNRAINRLRFMNILNSS